MTLSEKIIAYLRGTREEIRKVSWPSRQETIRYSALVVGASVVVAVFFAALDTGFTQLVDVAITQRARTAAPPSAGGPAPSAPVVPDTVPTPTAPATPKLDLNGLQTAPGSGAVQITPDNLKTVAPQPKK